MPDLIWRLVVDETRCHPDYLEQVLASPPIRERVMATASGTSASMRKINKRGLATVAIPLPDLATQMSYAEMCLSMGRTAADLLKEMAALRELRTNLLSDLLSCEVAIPAAYDSLLAGAV